MAIAELEFRGKYDESKHDLLFDSFAENGLKARDLAASRDWAWPFSLDTNPQVEEKLIREARRLACEKEIRETSAQPTASVSANLLGPPDATPVAPPVEQEAERFPDERRS